MAACGGWSIFCYPHFLAAENGGNAVKRAARGCRPWTPQALLQEGSSQGGNVVSSLLLLSLPLPWGKCRGFDVLPSSIGGLRVCQAKGSLFQGSCPSAHTGAERSRTELRWCDLPHPPSLRTGHPPLRMRAIACGRDGGWSIGSRAQFRDHSSGVRSFPTRPVCGLGTLPWG